VAQLETKHVFKGTVDQVFKAITNYQEYPNFLPGVTNAIVESSDKPKGIQRVRFDLNLIKTFYYVLDMTAKAPDHISWELTDSNLMKSNSGEWRLTPKGKTQTEATYVLDIKFKLLVPSAITDKVAKANLGNMFEGFQKIIDSQNS
jgi:ribosome-associated toxin RatA of RatAB toxin-antitoxin module